MTGRGPAQHNTHPRRPRPGRSQAHHGEAAGPRAASACPALPREPPPKTQGGRPFPRRYLRPPQNALRAGAPRPRRRPAARRTAAAILRGGRASSRQPARGVTRFRPHCLTGTVVPPVTVAPEPARPAIAAPSVRHHRPAIPPACPTHSAGRAGERPRPQAWEGGREVWQPSVWGEGSVRRGAASPAAAALAIAACVGQSKTFGGCVRRAASRLWGAMAAGAVSRPLSAGSGCCRPRFRSGHTIISGYHFPCFSKGCSFSKARNSPFSVGSLALLHGGTFG